MNEYFSSSLEKSKHLPAKLAEHLFEFKTEEEKYLFLFQQGQHSLAKDIIYQVELIRQAIALNDGSFTGLIEELKEMLEKF